MNMHAVWQQPRKSIDMDEDEKVRLARQGLDLLDEAAPDQIKERLKEAASEAAQDVVMGGVEVLARITGGGKRARTPGRSAPSATDVNAAMDAMSEHTTDSFDARLRAASAQAERESAQEKAALRADLARVRRSFPEESKELAVLVFSCVDLLGQLTDIAEGRSAATPAELKRKEDLLVKIATLLAPRAEESLESFVGHVVSLSRRSRGATDG